MSEWMPIETAPKDGTEILVYCPGDKPEIVSAHFIEGEGYALFRFTDDALCDIAPEGPEFTHWLPLPAPPEIADEESR